MHEKGQIVTFDLAVAIFILLIVFAAISLLWSSNLQNFQTQQEYDYMQTQAFILSEALVKTKGSPTNWETLQLDDVAVIGLAIKDRVLSTEKISGLAGLLSTDYLQAKSKLKQSIYDIFIKLDSLEQSTTDVNMGVAPTGNVVMVTIRRIVDYNNSEAVFDVTLYRSI